MRVKKYQVKVVHLILDKRRTDKRESNQVREIIKGREGQHHHLHLQAAAVHHQVHQVQSQNRKEKI